MRIQRPNEMDGFWKWWGDLDRKKRHNSFFKFRKNVSWFEMFLSLDLLLNNIEKSVLGRWQITSIIYTFAKDSSIKRFFINYFKIKFKKIIFSNFKISFGLIIVRNWTRFDHEMSFLADNKFGHVLSMSKNCWLIALSLSGLKRHLLQPQPPTSKIQRLILVILMFAICFNIFIK